MVEIDEKSQLIGVLSDGIALSFEIEMYRQTFPCDLCGWEIVEDSFMRVIYSVGNERKLYEICKACHQTAREMQYFAV